MTAQNPFNNTDPLLLPFPANKMLSCSEAVIDDHETYFNGKKYTEKKGWNYDNYFYRDFSFDTRQRRSDRVNFEDRTRSICADELLKRVPVRTSSWYGHQVAKYDQHMVMVPYGKHFEMQKEYRASGMPWPKRQHDQLDNDWFMKFSLETIDFT